MESSMKDRQNDIIESFQSIFGKEELLASDRVLPLSYSGLCSGRNVGAGE
jgi:hypothetical protein